MNIIDKKLSRSDLKPYLIKNFSRLDVKSYFGSWKEQMIKEFINSAPNDIPYFSSKKIDILFKRFLGWNPFGPDFEGYQ